MRLFAIGFACVISAITSRAATPVVTSNESLRNEVRNAIQRGAHWLSGNQNTNGYWSTPDQPAVTALALVALDPRQRAKDPQFAANFTTGYAFLESNIKSDGGIYKEGLANYNTSLALLA